MLQVTKRKRFAINIAYAATNYEHLGFHNKQDYVNQLCLSDCTRSASAAPCVSTDIIERVKRTVPRKVKRGRAIGSDVSRLSQHLSYLRSNNTAHDRVLKAELMHRSDEENEHST